MVNADKQENSSIVFRAVEEGLMNDVNCTFALVNDIWMSPETAVRLKQGHGSPG